MHHTNILLSIVALMAGGVFVITIFRRLKLSPVLGYLLVGAIIGDNGFKIISQEQTKFLAEFGVVFLLFAIGLELSFERLKAMRKYVFGLGSMQVIITALFIAGAVVLVTQKGSMAIIIGGGLALSSTAIVLQTIEDSGNQATKLGRISLSILLLQDFIVVPLLVIVPLLANTDDNSIINALGIALLKAIIALIAIFIVGRLFLRPFLGFISSDGKDSSELPIAMTLLIVLSAAWSTEYFGLSLALGAFIAGILVAETEYRVQAEKSIYPFKSLLLGLFFMTVGMNIDAYEIYFNASHIITLTVALIVIKTLIIAGICVIFNLTLPFAFQAGLLLSQGSEFAFILFDLARKNNLLDNNQANILMLVITCSMAITPLLAALGQKIVKNIEYDFHRNALKKIEVETSDLVNHVIIGGFGKVGKIIAKVLEAEGINYIAIDINDEIVKEEKKYGFPILKGDVAHLETLEALGAGRGATIILTMNNEITIKKSCLVIVNNFNNLNIVIKLKNLKKANEFYAAGANIIIPQDYETALQISAEVLKSVGISEYEINRIKEQFRFGNYTMTKQKESLFAVEENE